MARSRRKPATPVTEKKADAQADPSSAAPDAELEATPGTPPDALQTPPDPETPNTPDPAADAADAASELAPKADPAEAKPPAPDGLKDAAPPEPEKGDERKLLNDAREPDAEPASPPPDTPPAAPKPTVPADPTKLAPKVAEGDGGRKLPKYNIRKAAIAAELNKGVHQGAGLPALPPGKWRIMRDQQVMIRGHVTQLRAGTVITSATHDVAYLLKAGVALKALNERASDLENHGFDYDHRVK